MQPLHLRQGCPFAQPVATPCTERTLHHFLCGCLGLKAVHVRKVFEPQNVPLQSGKSFVCAQQYICLACKRCLQVGTIPLAKNQLKRNQSREFAAALRLSRVSPQRSRSNHHAWRWQKDWKEEHEKAHVLVPNPTETSTRALKLDVPLRMRDGTAQDCHTNCGVLGTRWGT